MVLVGEQRETHVGKDKILGKEVDEFEEIFRSPAGLFREVDEGVVGLHDPTEQDSHDTCVRRHTGEPL